MKKILGFTFYQLFFSLMLGSVLFVSVSLALPAKASALEISTSTQTRQLLPPGGSACQAISASNFTPYVYDGVLHSFEFTVSDASYVALAGTVGNTSLPFRVMTRRVDPSGGVRIHVDIEATPITGTLPLQVSMLSARVGQPVCLGVVSINVGSGPIQQNMSVSQPEPVASAVTPTQHIPTTPIKETPTTDTNPAMSSATSTESSETANATPTASVVGTMQNPLSNVCTSAASAYRLWLILLVLFTLVVGAVLWAEFPLSMPWARTSERVATIILVLLLLLLGFWYFSVPCRAALWMPLMAFLIALLGLLAAFWNHPRVTQLLLIQDSKP